MRVSFALLAISSCFFSVVSYLFLAHLQIACNQLFLSCWCFTPLASARPMQEAGACSNDADLATWATRKNSFQTDIESCAKGCLGREGCTSSCIEKKGFTGDCAACFGSLSSCTLGNCLSKCMLGQSKGCTDCVYEKCTPAFLECTGFSESDFPAPVMALDFTPLFNSTTAAAVECTTGQTACEYLPGKTQCCTAGESCITNVGCRC